MLIFIITFIVIIVMLESNTSKNNQFNITTQTITRNGYTVIKFLVREHTVYNGIQGIIRYIIDHFYILIGLLAALALIRYLKGKNSIIRVKITVNTEILDNYEKINVPLFEKRNNTEDHNRVYMLAKSLLKYPNENIVRLFRSLCGSRMKIVLLIEKHPGPSISNIIKIIKESMLEKCVHLKYIGNVKEADLNIIDVDEIMSLLNKSNVKSNTKYDINDIYYIDVINANENSNKVSRNHRNDSIVVFGRKKKYIIKKELYNELKRGIDVKELKEIYGNNIYNLLMDMYNDGIIIFNGNKMILVE